MMWRNWIGSRVEEALLREAGSFVSDQYEVLFMERFVNDNVSWILEVRRAGEGVVRRHELTHDELQHGMSLLNTLSGIVNTTLTTTPITTIRERVEERD